MSPLNKERDKEGKKWLREEEHLQTELQEKQIRTVDMNKEKVVKRS